MRFKLGPQIGQIYKANWPEQGCFVKVINIHKPFSNVTGEIVYYVNVINAKSERLKLRPQVSLLISNFDEFKHLARKNFWDEDEEDEDGDWLESREDEEF